MSRRELIALTLTLLMAVTGWWLGERQTPDASGNGFGTLFTLESAQGPVSLADYRGKVVVLDFGYTSCPDVCPTGLATLAAALDQLEESDRSQVAVFFITLDPERDAPQQVGEYARYFHPSITGLSGSREQLDTVAAAYGVFYRKVELPDSALGYALDHTARYYLLDRDLTVRGVLDHGMPPQVIAQAISELLRGID